MLNDFMRDTVPTGSISMREGGLPPLVVRREDANFEEASTKTLKAVTWSFSRQRTWSVGIDMCSNRCPWGGFLRPIKILLARLRGRSRYWMASVRYGMEASEYWPLWARTCVPRKGLRFPLSSGWSVLHTEKKLPGIVIGFPARFRRPVVKIKLNQILF